MTGPQSNKIFAALLIAGITAYLAAFVADKLVHPEELSENAVQIEGGEVAGGTVSGPTGPEPIMHLIASADVAKGETLSRACAACHSFDNGGPDKVGPNLYGIVGASYAHVSGFAYSDALQNMDGDWGYDSLNKFLYKPKSYVEGTKMNYIGMKSPEDRAAIIAWLRTLGSTSVALPSEGQIAAEKAELAPEPEVVEESAEDGETAEPAAEDAESTEETPAENG
jgi:cytochrome c